MVGVFLILVGQSSMIQGIISLSTSLISGLPWFYVTGTTGGILVAGSFFTVVGLGAQVVGLFAVFRLRSKAGRQRTDQGIRLTA
jgi:hypothetical protein